MKVAFVHDWLNGLRGGERCLQAFIALYPQADIFTLFHEPGSTAPEIDARVKQVSFLQRFPGARSLYRFLLPLYPRAVRSFDFSRYDLVISLSHAAAKNIVVPKGTLHVCYCFTPMRYIWDQAPAYLGKCAQLLWPIIAHLRRWDREGSRGVDCFVGISKFVAARIRCFYGRRSKVIYPPVDTRWITGDKSQWNVPRIRGEAFLCAGALVPYKRIEAIIHAFNSLREPLWVVGSGPEESKLRAIAGDTIQFFGHVTDAELAQYYRRCRALVFAGKEDFGMMPVECMAAGRPVIGLYAGGLKESVQAIRSWGPDAHKADFASATGVGIRPSGIDLVRNIEESVEFFIRHEERFRPEACMRQAALFGPDAFYAAWEGLARQLGIEPQGSSDSAQTAYA
ncbi:MAG: glycosyltransferase family 4 protein [Proteobacteria bacterium]|nr:glycosyltransferase family 4 protein [Pseudomonadota bacterium]